MASNKSINNDVPNIFNSLAGLEDNLDDLEDGVEGHLSAEEVMALEKAVEESAAVTPDRAEMDISNPKKKLEDFITKEWEEGLERQLLQSLNLNIRYAHYDNEVPDAKEIERISKATERVSLLWQFVENIFGDAHLIYQRVENNHIEVNAALWQQFYTAIDKLQDIDPNDKLTLQLMFLSIAQENNILSTPAVSKLAKEVAENSLLPSYITTIFSTTERTNFIERKYKVYDERRRLQYVLNVLKSLQREKAINDLKQSFDRQVSENGASISYNNHHIRYEILHTFINNSINFLADEKGRLNLTAWQALKDSVEELKSDKNILSMDKLALDILVLSAAKEHHLMKKDPVQQLDKDVKANKQLDTYIQRMFNDKEKKDYNKDGSKVVDSRWLIQPTIMYLANWCDKQKVPRPLTIERHGTKNKKPKRLRPIKKIRRMSQRMMKGVNKLSISPKGVNHLQKKQPVTMISR